MGGHTEAIIDEIVEALKRLGFPTIAIRVKDIVEHLPRHVVHKILENMRDNVRLLERDKKVLEQFREVVEEAGEAVATNLLMLNPAAFRENMEAGKLVVQRAKQVTKSEGKSAAFDARTARWIASMALRMLAMKAGGPTVVQHMLNDPHAGRVIKLAMRAMKGDIKAAEELARMFGIHAPAKHHISIEKTVTSIVKRYRDQYAHAPPSGSSRQSSGSSAEDVRRELEELVRIMGDIEVFVPPTDDKVRKAAKMLYILALAESPYAPRNLRGQVYQLIRSANIDLKQLMFEIFPTVLRSCPQDAASVLKSVDRTPSEKAVDALAECLRSAASRDASISKMISRLASLPAMLETSLVAPRVTYYVIRCRECNAKDLLDALRRWDMEGEPRLPQGAELVAVDTKDEQHLKMKVTLGLSNVEGYEFVPNPDDKYDHIYPTMIYNIYRGSIPDDAILAIVIEPRAYSGVARIKTFGSCRVVSVKPGRALVVCTRPKEMSPYAQVMSTPAVSGGFAKNEIRYDIERMYEPHWR